MRPCMHTCVPRECHLIMSHFATKALDPTYLADASRKLSFTFPKCTPQVDSPRMSPKTASGFIDQGFIRIHIPKKLPWDVLNPPDYIPPVVTWWWHCFPNPGTSPTSSTSHQSANVQHTKSTIKKKNKQPPRHSTWHLFTLYVSSDSLPRHKSCCWPSSPTAFTSSPANLCGVTTNHGYSRLNDHKGLYEWMTIGPTSIAHLPSPLEPSLS